jgi:rhodanese-related sulfurtransferase
MVLKGLKFSAVLLAIGLACTGFAINNSSLFKVVLGDHAAVPEVSTSRLVKILNKHQGVVIDVRPNHEYAMGHIPGSINIWENNLTKVITKRYPHKETLIVTYCNGIHCGKSRRVAKELRELGYKNAHRYQLGIPFWRALGFPCEVSLEGLKEIYTKDHTAWFIDARPPRLFEKGSLPNAKNVSVKEVKKAKKDGRLPYYFDHNTRLIVFGKDAKEAKALAKKLCQNAFHNVAYYPGSYKEIEAALLR